jgi:hypothetical protein
VGDNELRAKLFGEVHLHLGAHRTGSTSFQSALDANGDAIQAQGVCLGFAARSMILPVHQQSPEYHLGLRLRSQALNKSKRALKQQISKNRSEIAQIVKKGIGQQALLSEENLIGSMAALEQGRFYPHIHARMTLLRKVLYPSAIGNVLLVIRSYSSFFESAFRKRAEVNALPEFSEISKIQADFKGGWPMVVDCILDALRPKQLIVATYGRDRDDLELLGKLCPKLDVTDMKHPERWSNMSYSDRALFECQKRLHAGEVLSRDASWEIRDEFADAPSERHFAKLPPEVVKVLGERFQTDLDILRHHTGITMIDT